MVLVVWASYSAVPHLVGFASGVDGGAAGRSEVREVLRAEGGDGGGVKRPQDVFGESRTTIMKECLGHSGNADVRVYHGSNKGSGLGHDGLMAHFQCLSSV